MRALYNAKIAVQDGVIDSKKTALLLDHDRIAMSGSDDEVLAAAKPGTPKHNLGGRTVLPGLTDAHMHLEYFALGLQQVACETETISQCLQNVAEHVKITPAGDWILGWGFNQNVWPEGYGTAHDLDRIALHNPVFLTAKSGHAAWVNSLALQKAGITSATIDPEGGKILRDRNGNPTGVLFESAMSLVEKIIPEPSIQSVSKAITEAQDTLWKMGLTGLHDFDSSRSFSALQKLNLEDSLRLRVVKSIPVDMLSQAVAVGLRSGFGSDLLRVGSVKLFADGALGPQTAAMLKPYENSQDDCGILMLDKEQLFEYGQLAAKTGLSLATHAIGDLANHEIIDGYEALRAYEVEHHLPHLRHRIEHVQILHPDDFRRFSKLGIIASMQPIHATSDIIIADKHWGKRAQYAYAWQTLLSQKAALAFGSDAPVETPNPFYGIHAALTRRRIDGSPSPEGWYPAERVSLQAAIMAYTSGPAFAAGLEKQLGKLLPGYYADLVVLEKDIYTTNPEEIWQLKPLATMVGGEWVYGSI